MKKRLISLLLTLSMVFSMVPMLGIGVGAINYTHNPSHNPYSSTADLCDMLPYAYLSVNIENANLYISSYNIKHGYGYDELKEKLWNDSAIPYMTRENIAFSPNLSVGHLLNMAFNLDFQLTDQDVFDMLLVRMLMGGIVKSDSALEEAYQDVKKLLSCHFSDDFKWAGTLNDYLETNVISTSKQGADIASFIIDDAGIGKKLFGHLQSNELIAEAMGKFLVVVSHIFGIYQEKNECFENLAAYYLIWRNIGKEAKYALEMMKKDDQTLQEKVPELINSIDKILPLFNNDIYGLLTTASMEIADSKKEIWGSAAQTIGKLLVGFINSKLKTVGECLEAAGKTFTVFDIFGQIGDKSNKAWEIIVTAYLERAILNSIKNQENSLIEFELYAINKTPTEQINNRANLSYLSDAYVFTLQMLYRLMLEEHDMCAAWYEEYSDDWTSWEYAISNAIETWHDRYYDNILGVPLNRLAGDVQKINKGLTIKYDMNGGEGNITDTIKPYNEETNLTSIIPIKSGENFLGWEFDNTQYSSGMYVDASLNPCYCCDEVTFTAHYADIDAITYIADKATNVPASHENKGVLSNQVPRKTGYDFLGWDEDPNVKNPTYKAGDPISKTGDVTLYAIWNKVVFNIIFDADGPDGDGGYFPTSNTTTITKTKPYGEAFVIDVEKPVRPGYIFADQWTHLNPKTGRVEPFDHDPNKTIYDIGDETTIDKVLYPVWTDVFADVVYDHCDFSADHNNEPANVIEKTVNVENGTTYVLEDPVINSYNGNSFKGWMYYKNGGTLLDLNGNAYTLLQPGETIELDPTDRVKNDVYAKWTYYVHYNHGTQSTHSLVNDVYNLVVGKPSANGDKTFGGWFVVETGETLQPGDTIKLTSDITLNAIWNDEVIETPDVPVTYSVTYDWGDWVDGVVQTVKYDIKYHDVDYVLSSETPVYAKYIFKGWALDTDLHTPVYQPGDTYTDNADVVFYAVWEEPEIFSGPVTVSGYVVDYTKESENYGNPLSGVTVEFFDNETGESVGTAVTDSAGVYTFTFPAPGSYKKVLSKEGYNTFTVDTTIIVENTPSLGTSFLTQKRTIVAEGTCGDNLIWALDDEGLLTIDGSGEMDDYSLDTATPWASNKDKLKRIWLSEGITKIGSYAFYECASITGSLTIPDSVTEIGEWAFYKCTGLTGDLAIPDNVIKIGDHSFDRCYGFKGSLIISDGVTEIGKNAFYNCSGFSGSLTIPDGVTYIGDGAFYYCINFTGPLTLPNNITSIGNDVFNSCYSLTGSLEIPDSVSKIGEYAFFGCDFTGSLTIPDSVTDIGKRAFSSSGFTGTLTISKNITSIKDWTFGASNFTGALNIPNSVTCIGNNAFRACDFTGSLTIPDSVTEIGDDAFAYCDGLTGTLTIPESVTVIGDSAFRECTGLTGDLIIPDSVTSIGEYAFSKCSGFTGTLTISNNITTIPKYTFNGCEGFSGSLIIPNGVIEIGEYAFYACDGFSETLTISNTVTSIGSYAFSGCHNFTGTLMIPDSVTEIGEYAFWCCCNFKGTLTIPDSVTLIGNHAFYSCQGFSSLILPNSITSIEDWVFCSCNFTGTLIIPESITSIGDDAFWGCDFTGTIIIPDSVTSIGSNAFVLCRGIDKAFFHGDVPEIWGNCVFDDNAEGFLIYYQENTSGWTSPKWTAPDGSVYNTAVWSGFTADLNGDGATTEADALYLLRHTILPARYPLSTDDADFDGNGIVNAKDAAWLKQRIN